MTTPTLSLGLATHRVLGGASAKNHAAGCSAAFIVIGKLATGGDAAPSPQ